MEHKNEEHTRAIVPNGGISYATNDAVFDWRHGADGRGGVMKSPNAARKKHQHLRYLGSLCQFMPVLCK